MNFYGLFLSLNDKNFAKTLLLTTAMKLENLEFFSTKNDRKSLKPLKRKELSKTCICSS